DYDVPVGDSCTRSLRDALPSSGGPAVVATDLDGTITYWSAAAERLFGWPASDLIGRHVSTIGAASERSLTSEQIQGGLTRLEPRPEEHTSALQSRDNLVRPHLP